jgi:hypothetical protein
MYVFQPLPPEKRTFFGQFRTKNVNNELLVFAQLIEGGDNVIVIHTQGNDLIRSLPDYGFQVCELIGVIGDCAFCSHHQVISVYTTKKRA